MSTSLLLILMLASSVGGRAFSKMSSRYTEQQGTAGYAVYLLISGCVASLFFFLSGGCTLAASPLTLLYALAYALIVTVICVCTLKTYQYAEVANVTVITSACGLVTTSTLGFLLFGEQLTLMKAVRMTLMLSAILLIFADVRRRGHRETSVKRRKGFAFPLLILTLILAGSASTIELKLFSQASGVTGENALFLYTNVFMVLFVLIWLAWQLRRKPETIRAVLPSMSWRTLLPMAGETVTSNINSLAGLWLLAAMEVSIYTPAVSAIEIISGVTASILLKEHFGKLSIAAMLLALIAVVI